MNDKNAMDFHYFAENLNTLLTAEIWEQALKEQEEKERHCFEKARSMVAKEAGKKS